MKMPSLAVCRFVSCLLASLALSVPAASALQVTQIFDGGGEGLRVRTPGLLAVAPDGTAFAKAENRLYRIAPGGTVEDVSDWLRAVAADGSVPANQIEVDAAGNLYVLARFDPSPAATKLYRFAPDGQATLLFEDVELRSFGVDAGPSVYVALCGFIGDPCTVLELPAMGTPVTILDPLSGGFQPLTDAGVFAFDCDGNVYLKGRREDGVFLRPRVVKLPAAGPPEEILGPEGDGVHPYNDGGKSGLAATCDGTIYSSGSNSRNVFRIPPGGGPEQVLAFPRSSAFPDEIPDDLVVDTAANLYVGTHGSTQDVVRGRVLRRTPLGDVSEVVSPDGDGTDPLRLAGAVGIDSVDRVYVMDRGVFPPVVGASGNVFRLDGGAIERLLGSDNPAFGTARVAADAAGNAYVTGVESDNLFRVAPGGAASQLLDAAGDGLATFDSPGGVAVDADGNVFVAGRLSDNVFRVSPADAVNEVISNVGDGAHLLIEPRRVATDSAGNLFVAGFASDNVFRVAPGGAVQQILGPEGDGAHPLDGPEGIATDPDGNVYVVGSGSHNAFRVTPDGTVTQVLGPEGDGVNQLRHPVAVAAAADGTVYVGAGSTQPVVAPASDNVFRIAPGGAVAEIFEADSTRAPLRDLAIDADGNLFAAFRGRLAVVLDDALWRIAPGVPERLLNPNDAPGPLDGVNGVAVDPAGNVYVAAQFSDTVYRLAPEAGVAAQALAALGSVLALRALAGGARGRH